MIEKFRSILNELEAKGQTPVVLFAVLKMDDITDRWTILFSNEDDLMNEANRKIVFDNLLSKIRTTFSQEELALVARIGILPKTDHIIESLLKYQSGAKIHNEKVNGNFVHDGYVIRSAALVDAKEDIDLTKSTQEKGTTGTS